LLALYFIVTDVTLSFADNDGDGFYI